ncbi:NADH-FMN oxidoreductase RutF, flavin reductase (DIM6/NTAB) family [Carnobacterium iners]|uniref:NADH-FMN oxidoreductase RutF, flavin reductase (DIM6/NTAB) family n=1 Tax=Carnobacterium iners TaxID=1073423 RepID=A0A1X7N3M1_9LACT|nr:flavin reductase family protein [Carnobacterium iners]SEK61861.1 NADH-FMN oxidoreductase RutF, flavin reductase (DIM6/NTAB) family [Carnobacterium iners]SMH31957.1 NADH-FMN oxidoreductase RutF, flavin reductase (DIM6/NTAB) family [Carnobacterium iners]
MAKLKIDFDTIDEASRMKLVKGSIIPRPIAWITSSNENGSINLAPFSYFNVISPTLVIVSFQRNGEQQKDTFVNISREREAVIHIVDESLISAMDISSTPLARNKSELELTDLNLSPSMKVKTPGIKEALIRFEVVLEESLTLKDYDKNKEEADLVILRVIASVIDETVYDLKQGYVLSEVLRPVARLGGTDYAGIQSLPFKRNF